MEEIVQDVFVNLWVKSSSLDVSGNLKAYLYATLRNMVLNELRSQCTRSAYREKIKQLTKRQECSGGLEVIYARETEAHINQIIATLSPQCRKAFRLSRFEHFSYKEVADQMQISVNTVEKHVAKALRILRGKLTEYGDVIQLVLIFIVLTMN